MLKSKNKLLHKALAFVLTFSLLAALVSLNFTVSALEEAGTASEPYKISDEQDLKDFAAAVLSNNNVYAVLEQDIILSESWTPIGKNSDGTFVKYTGVFDGGNNTITFSTVTDGEYVGLFGINEGTIKNVTVAGSSISSSTKKAFVGGVAGLNRGTITNCENSATIKTTGVNSYAGGIAGVMQNGTIESCKNTGAITVTVSDNSSSDVTDHEASAGGIVAFNYNGTVKKCENTAAVTNDETYGYTGGIVGNNDGTINNCLNGGIVTNGAAEKYAGGIAGNLFTNKDTGSTATISNCLNTNDSGKILGSNGIETKDETKGIVTNSYYKANNESDDDNIEGTTAVTEGQLKSGEVTYMLNGNTAANPVWGQTNLNNDSSLPVIGAAEKNNTIVYPNNGNGYTNTKPTPCSNEHTYKNGVCTECFDVAAKVAGYSVTLDGTIGLKFYYDISKNITNIANEISYNKDTTKEEITRTANLTIAKEQTDVPEGYTRYFATVPVDSDQMNLNITTTLTYDSSSTDTVTSNAYNVNQYLNKVYSDPVSILGTSNANKAESLKKLTQIMSTYGYYSNKYFGLYPHYETTIPEYNLTVSANDLSNDKYNIKYDGKVGDLTHYASSLQYLEQVAGIFYVNNISNYVQGDTNNVYMKYEVLNIDTNSKDTSFENKSPMLTILSSNKSYAYQYTEKIPTAKLGKIKFAVTFGTMENGEFAAKSNTKYYSPYTYVKNILTKYETTSDTNNTAYKLTQALYHYSEAAAEYFPS